MSRLLTGRRGFFAALFSHGGPSAFVAIFFPVMYPAAGFIGDVLVAAVYNLVGSWIGGVEITLDQVAPRQRQS